MEVIKPYFIRVHCCLLVDSVTDNSTIITWYNKAGRRNDTSQTQRKNKKTRGCRRKVVMSNNIKHKMLWVIVLVKSYNIQLNSIQWRQRDREPRYCFQHAEWRTPECITACFCLWWNVIDLYVWLMRHSCAICPTVIWLRPESCLTCRTSTCFVLLWKGRIWPAFIFRAEVW